MKPDRWPNRNLPCPICLRPFSLGNHSKCSLEMERRKAAEPCGKLRFTKLNEINAKHNANKRNYSKPSVLDYFSKLDK